MDPAQVVEILRQQLHRQPGQTIDEAIRLRCLIEGAVERGAVHGAVEVCQALRAFADHAAHLLAALQGQLEFLEALGAVDRMEQPGPADLIGAAVALHVAVDADEVRQISGVRVRDLFGFEADEVINEAFHSGVHHGVPLLTSASVPSPRSAPRRSRSSR